MKYIYVQRPVGNHQERSWGERVQFRSSIGPWYAQRDPMYSLSTTSGEINIQLLHHSCPVLGEHRYSGTKGSCSLSLSVIPNGSVLPLPSPKLSAFDALRPPTVYGNFSGSGNQIGRRRLVVVVVVVRWKRTGSGAHTYDDIPRVLTTRAVMAWRTKGSIAAKARSAQQN